MVEAVSFTTTKSRIEKMDGYIKNKNAPHRSAFINNAIDSYFRQIETHGLFDFMYFIGLPFFIFLISIGTTIIVNSLFFYLVSALFGFYLMIFGFLYYAKYKGVKK